MYEIDELANIVAMASELEQKALTGQIRENGQIDAVVLWRGKIIDGRCRQLACEALGRKLRTRSLDSNLSKEEVARIVKSLNIRRNLTQTQKAMSAYKEQLASGVSNSKSAESWGIPLGTYKNAKYLATYGEEYVEDLFNGKSVKILDPDKGFEITTAKLNTIARIIKKTKELAFITINNDEELLMEWSVEGTIKTEQGKDWYYNKIAERAISQNSVGIRMDYVELANLKFKLGGESV